jgi:2,4-dienoyl-CoA reductase-like NADH-dependent reductase (Old Yellow Enzyme family)
MKLMIKTSADLAAEAAAAEQARAVAEARAYLADTDWMVIRAAESGKPVPDDVIAARVAARVVISG